MEYRRLGSSGLQVSRIVLGCMSFGDPDRGAHSWVVEQEESFAIIRAALEAGITTWDTANVYSLGASEEIVGAAIREFTRREEIVLATKVHGVMRPGANGGGLSRGAIMTQVEASLRRLGTDYIDLYQIHRYDPATPIEETLQALDDLIRQGKVRYVGASSMAAWQFAQALYKADIHGWTRFASMQDQYSLLMREEEREMHPLCQAEGIGVLPWSPLARGRLTREWDQATKRSTTDTFGQSLYGQTETTDRKIADAVGAIATRRGISRAQVALAWVLAKPAVTAPIVGMTKLAHLTDAVAALDVHLTEADIAELEAHYVPHHPEGF